VPVAAEEAPEDGHMPTGQRLLEDGAREAVDLDDQEARRPATGGAPSLRRRTIRSIAPWARRNRSSRIIRGRPARLSSPLRNLASRRVHGKRATHGQEIEAPVVEEPAVLGGEDRRRNEARHVGQRQRPPTLESRLPDSGEQLRFELRAGHVPVARHVRHLDDPGTSHVQANAHGGREDVLAGSKMDLPPPRGSAELAGLRRRI
jgi:hypothetical protein